MATMTPQARHGLPAGLPNRGPMKTTIRAAWFELTSQHVMGPGREATPAEAAISTAAESSPSLFLNNLRQPHVDADGISYGRGVAGYMRDGWCIFVHEFIKDSYARVHPDEMIRLSDWWIAVQKSPNFKNPDAEFEPIEIEYDLDIPDELHPDFTFAVYIAEEWCPSGNWKRAKKIDDVNAVYVWEPDGKQRSMIVSYDEIEKDVAYDDRFVLGSQGTTFEELHTAFTAGIRTDPADLRMWQ